MGGLGRSMDRLRVRLDASSVVRRGRTWSPKGKTKSDKTEG